ncbi:pRL2-11 [Streptomyces sp. WAC01280]|uniref:pRL2-11 n=1 Tax=Streptomyces sp. WAC01280 TaxID=2487424 RepID=UPI000F795081|nr:pRL2-11 [Streptomyces sp. WAC01280]RSS57505.1 pRL2-11 [Streptomyces sp. WAC01280]
MSPPSSRGLDEAVDNLAEVAVRFFAGQDLDGVRRTDATFWQPGRRVVVRDADGPVRRASYRAGWRRLTVRMAALAAAIGGAYGYLLHPDAITQALTYGAPMAALATAACGATYRIKSRERRELLQEWVEPLHQAIAGPLQISEHTDPRTYLHVPADFADDDAEIRVDLPLHLRFNRETVAELVMQKLALQNASFSWRVAGRDPHLIVKKKDRPPTSLGLNDPGVRELLASMPESAPLIGLGAGKRKVSVDLDHDSPHVLISAGTGGGKSTILRTIACQFLHNGAQAHILDFKRISHTWARGVPRVNYCRDIAEIHDALIELGAEGHRRIRLAEQLGDDVLAAKPDRVGPRTVILLEEINATMSQLRRYWEKVRSSDDPKTSPAIDALAEILFMGRQVRLHVLLVAQSATARALGGPEMRENFSTRILVRYTLNAWKMLVPEVHPAPKPTRHPGRVQVVLGGAARETQVLHLSEAEARAWAMAGSSGNMQPITLREAATEPNPGEQHPPRVREAEPDKGPQRPEDALVALREAQRDLGVVSLAALRWARANDAEFPTPDGKRGTELLYRVGDLQRWARNRPRAAS